MIDKFENTILKNLIYNEEFIVKQCSLSKRRFFKDRIETILFNQINTFSKI